MLYLLAAFLIQPAISPQAMFSAEKIAKMDPIEISLSVSLQTNDRSTDRPMFVALSPTDIRVAPATNSESASASEDSVKNAEIPAEPAAANLPAALLAVKPSKPMTVSVSQLQVEDRNKVRLWMGLGIASHAAATFDAWSTRTAITTAGAHELNPMLRPFSGNASIYLAVQVGPAVMDFVGKKMMYSSHGWMRRMWWVPQAASFAGSILSGAHNVGVQAGAN